MEIITCTAPVNIAVIKYWGKRNEKLILPINDSISVTLSSDQMHAKTTVARSKSFTADRIWLNGIEERIDNPRLSNCLQKIRQKAQVDDDEYFHICSENNFPTAAGLASSAAGYACLGKCLLCSYWDKNIFKILSAFDLFIFFLRKKSHVLPPGTECWGENNSKQLMPKKFLQNPFLGCQWRP